MRVAFLIDNLGSGGAQRQAVEVAVRLRQRHGVEVDFGVYRDVDFFVPRLEQAGIQIALLPKRGAIDPRFPGEVARWVGERQPDVVHAFLPLPVVWAALARRRARGPLWIAGERSSPIENLGRGLAPIVRWAYRRCDAVTANSVRAQETLVERWRIPAERVHYLPNGIDLAEWDRRAARECPVALDPGAFHVALVGRFSEEKNHGLLLEALSRVEPGLRRRVRLWFFGAEGPASEPVRAAIERHGLGGQVTCHGPTPELASLLSHIHALVLPSRFEGSPNVVLEAMASGLPVVASDVGDVPSLVTPGETGWRVPVGDPEALAHALGELLAAPEEARARMGAAARAAVETRFTIDVVAQLHLDLYRRLADELRSHAEARPLG